ncbi:aldose 1-epimerase family protein [Catellatospora bangladeshensis]|uniref:Aldose 1-epimerase n=1 Tax=Catellatospora bangladeshensis TaxID=310355 RepID=A0A8J3JL46_9ACTN|nr:aldose 1-epimerase family protein [Catellatospora bangladeshensis]GIF82507.1 aldose 1-epimerase [Catellatospora bangladeshensis]
MTDFRPSGTQWTLTYGAQTATVVEVGGGLRDYAVDGNEILDGYAEDELCPAGAGQVLMPWPNRIRDGHYRFGGSAHQLPLSEVALHNAIHGLVRWLPWQVVDRSDAAITVECGLEPQVGYPWRLSLRVAYTLGEDGLTVTHSAVNRSADPAPFGVGTHPYLRVPGAAIDDLTLTVPARTRLLVDGRMLPIGAAKVAGGEFDFTEPRRLGALELDTAFGDLVRDEAGGSAVSLVAPDGRAVEVWADEKFHWWQLFTAHTLTGERHRRAIAVEPMTCPPDAMRSGRDLIELAPGETWTGTWGIRHRLGA